MVTSLFMSYTNPYTVDQPINPYANLYTNPELNTIDNNQEQLRQIVQEENEKLRKQCLYWCCVILWIIIFFSFMLFILVYLPKRH